MTNAKCPTNDLIHNHQPRCHCSLKHWIILLSFVIGHWSFAPAAGPTQKSETGITHSFLVTGGETYILSDDSKIIWKYPANTRDGWVLENGHILLAVTKSKEYPHGGIVEVD